MVKLHKPPVYECPCEACTRIRQLSPEEFQAELDRMMCELSRREMGVFYIMRGAEPQPDKGDMH
jgi:hypothetical protein